MASELHPSAAVPALVSGRRRRHARTALASAASLLAIAAGAAHGQVLTQPAPVYQHIDGNSVDLSTGALAFSRTDLSIGSGPGALTHTLSFYGTGWSSNYSAQALTGFYPTVYVTVGTATMAFVTSDGVNYADSQGLGNLLTYNSTIGMYTLKSRTGHTAYFTGSGYPLVGDLGPAGESLSYSYNSLQQGGNTYSILSSVSSNAGYEIIFSGNPSTYPAALLPTHVYGFNSVLCPPPGTGCTASATASYTLSGAGNLATATDSAGRVTHYTYDGSNRITQIQTPAGVVATITYVGTGTQVASISNGAGTWTYSYSTVGSTMTTTVKDPNGNQRVVTVNTTNKLIASDQDALGHATSYQYDTYNRVTKITYPEGDNVNYTYDHIGGPTRGDVVQTTYLPKSGSGSITTWANFDDACTYPVKCNQPNSTIDVNGSSATDTAHKTDYTYDTTYGSLLTVTSPPATTGAVRPQTRYGYTVTSSVNLLTTVSTCQTQTTCAGTSDEVKTTISYPTAGSSNGLLPTSETVASGATGGVSATTSQTYDGIGNVLTVTGPLGSSQTTRYRYDGARQLVGVVAASPSEGGLANLAERITYNGDGNVTNDEKGTAASQSDADWANFSSQQQVATTFDAQQRPSKVTATTGGTTLKVSQLTYDNANRLLCSAVRTASSSFGALPASACAATTEAGSSPDQITSTTYDAVNRPLVVTHGYGTSAASNYTTFVYTNDGLVQSVQDAKGNLTSTTYDGFNRASQVTFPGSSYETYAYDNSRNMTSRRLRSGDTLTFTYDALNRVTLKHYSSNAVNQDIYLGYDLLNRALYARFGSAGGSGVTNVYDALGRVTSTADSNSRTISYSYDAAGDRTQLTYADTGANALAVQYAYDNLQRVTSITENSSYTLAGFSYDALGRRTGISRGPSGSLAGTGYGYDGLDRLSQLTQTFASSGNNLTLGLTPSPSDQLATKSVSNATYAYPPPAPGSTSYVANTLNQYSSVAGTSYTYDGRGNLTSDGSRSFTYDLDNHLLTASAPTAVSLSYDPLGRLQTSTAGGVTTNYLYDGDALVAEYDGSGNILRRYVPGPGVDEPVLWYEGAGASGRRWLHADDLGSVIAYSDTSANPQATYVYGPFGEPSVWSGSRYRYTGQLMIPEAHLYNYKARVYDPGLGRFLQTDPVGYSSDINTYAYAGNDSINGSDPSGELTCKGDSGGEAFGDNIVCYNEFAGFFSVSNSHAGSTGGGDRLVAGRAGPSPQNKACSAVPPSPPGTSVDKNISTAAHIGVVDFYNMVRNHGPWDYKQQGSQYQNFGNFNYGATAASQGSFPTTVIDRMAGWAQQRAGTSKPEWGGPLGSAPYGDDPADQQMVNAGIQYYWHGCHQ
jgi:RHS repeat-associated protein